MNAIVTATMKYVSRGLRSLNKNRQTIDSSAMATRINEYRCIPLNNRMTDSIPASVHSSKHWFLIKWLLIFHREFQPSMYELQPNYTQSSGAPEYANLHCEPELPSEKFWGSFYDRLIHLTFTRAPTRYGDSHSSEVVTSGFSEKPVYEFRSVTETNAVISADSPIPLVPSVGKILTDKKHNRFIANKRGLLQHKSIGKTGVTFTRNCTASKASCITAAYTKPRGGHFTRLTTIVDKYARHGLTRRETSISLCTNGKLRMRTFRDILHYYLFDSSFKLWLRTIRLTDAYLDVLGNDEISLSLSLCQYCSGTVGCLRFRHVERFLGFFVVIPSLVEELLARGRRLVDGTSVSSAVDELPIVGQ
ncbi:hypothetical protein CLF_107587 [Clonorchis sinensis]|uniref:Uncharacterized protein n=1 Tax=Clonorchis sinensis TaxID=79923 RepID=G7YGW9_CLOSI|nr:hypothetical protein CLF_107587 [Clonorchis sinensis]